MPYLRFRCPAGHQFVSRTRDAETDSAALELDCRGISNGSRCERRASALIANRGNGRTTDGAQAS